MTRTLVVVVVCAVLQACGAATSPPGTIQSKSPDELPPTQTSGLGTPGGDTDAGLPHVPLDGSAPRGSGQVP